MILPLLLACTSKDPAGTVTPPPTDSATTDTAPIDSGPTESTPTDSTASTPENLDWVDDDGDGYTERQGDCDDEHSSVNPDMEEDCETYANDDCAHGYNDGCKVSAWLEEYGTFVWTTEGVVYADHVAEMVPSGGGPALCRSGGELVDVPGSEAVPCPSCDWTFRGDRELANVWSEGSCQYFVWWWDDAIGRNGGPTYPVGFTRVQPPDSSVESLGWLVGYSVTDSEWFTRLPGYWSYWGYSLSVDDAGGSVTWTESEYFGDWYVWYPYGPPTRDYNP